MTINTHNLEPSQVSDGSSADRYLTDPRVEAGGTMSHSYILLYGIDHNDQETKKWVYDGCPHTPTKSYLSDKESL